MNFIHNQDDFATEPVRGLPAPLPAGEFILWQGAPSWRAFAREVFRTRLIAGLIAAGMIARIGYAAFTSGALGPAAGEALIIGAFGTIGIAILMLLAYLVERTTVYTITNKRVMMRIGVALQKTFNVPFSVIDGASLKDTGRDTGSVSLSLKPDVSLAYLILWPHARPWKMRHTEPTLRSVPKADRVAQLLHDAFTSSALTNEVLIQSANGEALDSDAVNDQREASQARALAASQALKKAQEEDATQHKLVDQHYISKPMMMLAACAALLTVLVVGYAQITGQSAQRANTGAPVFAHELSFVTQADDGLSIMDLTIGEEIARIPAGSDGLLRGALRGLSMTRNQASVAADEPYLLQRFADDGVYLADPTTGRSIRLESFGPIFTGATADLIQLAYGGTAEN